MAALIAGKKLPMRRCKTIDLEVPASVDIVVEGRFLPNERRPEGPFGEFMGNYVEVGDNHVFEVTHVSYPPRMPCSTALSAARLRTCARSRL